MRWWVGIAWLSGFMIPKYTPSSFEIDVYLRESASVNSDATCQHYREDQGLCSEDGDGRQKCRKYNNGYLIGSPDAFTCYLRAPSGIQSAVPLRVLSILQEWYGRLERFLCIVEGQFHRTTPHLATLPSLLDVPAYY
jgi:hypothetical protein